MTYNIKSLSLLAGLIVFALIFAISGVMYLCCKTRNSVVRKKIKLQAEQAEAEGFPTE